MPLEDAYLEELKKEHPDCEVSYDQDKSDKMGKPVYVLIPKKA